MPQNKLSSKPPEVMTMGKAMPVLVIAGIFDLARAFFNMFWFFGPAIAVMVCTNAVNSVVGTSIAETAGKVIATGCTAAGVAGGTAASAFTTPLGILMADAVGLAGFLTLGLWILIKNARLFKSVATGSFQFAGAFALSELPIIGTLPFLTFALWRLYQIQIRTENAALQKWKKETGAAQQKQQAQVMQAQAIGQTRIEQQEAAIREQEEAEALEAEEAVNETFPASVPEFGSASVKTTPSPQLATVPNYSRSAANEPANNVFRLFPSRGARETQREVPKEERKAA